MSDIKRSLILGSAAIGSIAIGGLIAWNWGRSDIGRKNTFPTQDVIATADPAKTFQAPAELPDGSIRSVLSAWEDGSDREIEYRRKDNTLTCTVRFYKSGRKEREVVYLRGEGAGRIHERGWFENGDPHFDYFKERDQLHGPYLLYWPTGYPHGQGAYREGREHGAWRVWNERGVRIETATYADGCLHGPWACFDQTGAPQMRGTYDRGYKVGEWLYYEGPGKAGTRREMYPETAPAEGDAEPAPLAEPEESAP